MRSRFLSIKNAKNAELRKMLDEFSSIRVWNYKDIF